MTQRSPVRIAHGYGNRRRRIERAIAAGVDLIETDLRYQDGVVWVRHEHRAGRLPLLSYWRPRGIHRAGPYAVAVGPLFLRLDVRPIRLPELIDWVSGRAGLLLDLKAGRYSPDEPSRFVEAVLATLNGARFAGQVAFSGSWSLLDLIRAREPGLSLHYSVGSEREWQRLLARLDGPGAITGISIRRRLLTEDRGDLLRRSGIDVYCWNIDDASAAAEALARGASGIIADDLDLLRCLVPGAPPDAARVPGHE